MSAGTSCPQCGLAQLPDAPAGLCPRCLLRAAQPRFPRPFGKFQLLERIGAGGMGVIFAAQETSPHRTVALKMIRGGELATPEERERFRREADAASRLDHPHIVRILDVGEIDGRAYYTMFLLRGGTLAQHRERLRANPQESARIVATIARAVHHGHLRAVLHRDLKPANILFDDEGQPHVTDFGIAKSLEGDPTETAGLLGTPAYMSPEQAGAGAQITTRSDVWSLGAILYELLTGRLPFEGASTAHVLDQVRTAEPTRPRTLDPRIDRDLETIILKCLEKQPERRYSAEQLAMELDRFLRGEPIAARPIGGAARLWRWSQRHPAAAAFGATAILFVSSVGAATLAAARAQENDRRADVLLTNAYAARAVAGTALFQLRELGDIVEAAAADPAVVEWLQDPAIGKSHVRLDGVLGEFRKDTFDSIGILDVNGRATARSPFPEEPDYLGKDFRWREYFLGASRNGQHGRRIAYMARAHESEVTHDYKFTISAPVFGSDGKWSGVVFATIGTDSVLAGVPLDPSGDVRHTVALLALRDNERAWKDRPLSDEYAIVVHEGLPHGKPMPAVSHSLRDIPPPDPDAEQLSRHAETTTVTDPEYRDPVPGFEGRWLAGFAPVGHTGYVVAVQTRHATLLDPDKKLAARLLTWSGVPFALGAVAIGAVLFRRRRRSA